MWKIRWKLLAHQIEKSRLKLDQITNDLMPDLVIVLWMINFKSIPSLEEHWCRHSCCSCPVANTKQSSGDSGCTLHTIVFFQLSPTNKHPMTSNPFELVVALLFQSSAMIDVIQSSFEQHFEVLQSFSSWWSSDASDDVSFWWPASEESASDDVSFRTTCLQNLFSSDVSSFLLVDSIALICSFRTYVLIKTLKILSMVLHTWTNISISNWQSFNTLLSSKLKGWC